jgi:hypothetical protein
VTRRLLLGYLAITLMVLGVLAVPLGISYQKRQTQRFTRDLVGDAFVEAGHVQHVVRTGVLTPDVEANEIAYAKRVQVRMVVITMNGDRLLDTDPGLEGDTAANFADRPEFQLVLRLGKVATGKRFSKTLGSDLVYVAVPISDEARVIGALRLSFPTKKIDKDSLRYWLFLTATSLVSLLAVRNNQ